MEIMPRLPRLAPLLALFLLAPLLGSCVPAVGVRDLDFRPGPAGGTIDPATLLSRQRVPADRLLGVEEALNRAPAGSLLLVCWRDTDVRNFWGPCSHVSRKYGPGQVAEQLGMSHPKGAGVYPQTSTANRYAVIVLDVGVRPGQLPAMWAQERRLRGQPYSLTGAPGSYYCSNYQNSLQHAAGLPDAIPFNRKWFGYLPVDALTVPGVKVLWVGINPASPEPYTR